MILLVVCSWLRVNIPLYAEKAINTISPYVALGWSKITFGIQYVWEVSTPHREWLYIKLLQLTDQVISHARKVVMSVGKRSLCAHKTATSCILK